MSSNRMNQVLDTLQDVIGQDAGGRGMRDLIVEGDLRNASVVLASLSRDSQVLVLSGFPCCVTQTPPTETDGPPGAMAIARAAVQLGSRVTVVTDDCNRDVFAAALDDIGDWSNDALSLQTFPPQESFTEEHEKQFEKLKKDCHAIIACERAGPAADGHCYTMRGIDMTAKGLIAPLEKLLSPEKPFIAIGDGGNEMGMGKVLQKILDNPKIRNAHTIASVVPSDYLIAASVSNWGGYALAAGAALVRAYHDAEKDSSKPLSHFVKEWLTKCLATKEEEVTLLERCVEAGCRDGVSGKQEATVDGMPLEASMECLENIRKAALSAGTE